MEFTKLKHKLSNILESAHKLKELTYLGFKLGKLLGGKFMLYDFLQQVIDRTSNLIGILLLGWIINAISSGATKDYLFLILFVATVIPILSSVFVNVFRRKYDRFSRFLELNIADLTYKKYKEIPVIYRNTPDFLKIEKNVNFDRIPSFFNHFVNAGAFTYSLIAYSLTITFVDPTLIIFAILIASVSLYLESKAKVKMWQKKDETNFHKNVLYSFQDNFKLKRVDEIDDNIKTHDNSRFLKSIYDKKIVQDFKEYFDLVFTNDLGKTIMFSRILTDTGLALIAFLIIYYAIEGKIQIGTLAILMTSYRAFLSELRSLNNSVIALLDSYLNLTSTKEFFDFTVPHKNYLTLDDRKKFSIEFINVSFTYPNSKVPILKNVSFKLESGDRVGIIGVNGAGKSTIIKLLFKIFIPTTGEILVNGVNIHDIKDEELYEVLTNLAQAEKIENIMKVKDVIRLGDSHRKMDLKEIIHSSRMSNADKDIEKLSFKYEQHIGSKGLISYLNDLMKQDTKLESLSDGQARKVQIAKMFYSHKPIIVLDEPTSNVDPQSAYEVFKNLNRLKNNHILIFVTHDVQRLVLAANKVIVLDEGKVIEKGEVEKLLKVKDSHLNKALETFKKTIRE
jgi:ATP-binding cassette subfamily B protein